MRAMRRFSGLVAAVWSVWAWASVEQPFPGLTLVRQGGSSMIIANLCAPGVQVRATSYAERKATPQGWAEAVGAQAAINADFFDFPGWTLVNGRARGNGQDWPIQYRESRSYWKFGPKLADLEQNAAVVPAAAPAVTEVVGGHNILIRNGQSLAPSFDGDAVITSSHRRTAIGLSRDKQTLFLFATDKVLNGTGLVAELRALQGEAGGPEIDFATNMDGGGSSQLYVQGKGQVVTSGRQVNNHLGVFARGTGASPQCSNTPPRGNVDSVTCDGVSGWAQDTDDPKKAIDAHVYFGGPAGSGARGVAIRAEGYRPDLCAPLGSCEHAFVQPLPLSFFDGQPHPVHAYGIDLTGGTNPEIGAKTVTCSREPPAGTVRHITDPGVLTAWKLDTFFDLAPMADGPLAARTVAATWPKTPRLVRAAMGPKVWVVDGTYRRHVPSVQVAAAWRFDLSKVETLADAELDALVEGPPLRARPYLVKGTGAAVYILDDVLAPWSTALPVKPGEAMPGVAPPEDTKPVADAGSAGGGSGAGGGSSVTGGGSANAGGGGEAPMEPSGGGCAVAPGLFGVLGLAALLRRRRR